VRKIDVFFYGLFMDEDLLRTKGITSPNLRVAFVPGFQLRIGHRATLVPIPSERVFGVVASLSHRELERLYSEPSVQAYKPEAVLAHLLHGEILAALCFNLVESPSASEHNPAYATKLRALAEQLQLPPDYVLSIQGALRPHRMGSIQGYSLHHVPSACHGPTREEHPLLRSLSGGGATQTHTVGSQNKPVAYTHKIAFIGNKLTKKRNI